MGVARSRAGGEAGVAMKQDIDDFIMRRACVFLGIAFAVTVLITALVVGFGGMGY